MKISRKRSEVIYFQEYAHCLYEWAMEERDTSWVPDREQAIEFQIKAAEHSAAVRNALGIKE